MNSQLLVLSELQSLERQKTAVAARKAGIDAGEARLLWEEIRGLAQSVVADRARLSGLDQSCARHEAELTAHTQRCRALEDRLYGGGITNAKEIEQIRAKCEALRRDMDRHENEAVAALEEQEGLAAKIARDEACLQTKRRLHAEAQQRMAREAAAFDAEIAALEGRCRMLAGQVEPGLLRAFRDLSRRLPQPVARVANGVCEGCRRSLPTGQLAKAGEKVLHCDNCGRMLLVE